MTAPLLTPFARQALRTAWAATYGQLPNPVDFERCLADPARCALLHARAAQQLAHARAHAPTHDTAALRCND